MFILIPLGFVMLAAVIYLALSKQSSFTIRIAALIALGVMILSVIISLFIIFLDLGAAKPEGPFLPFVEQVPVQQPKGNFLALVGFVLFLIALFVVVFFLSLKEHRKAAGKETI
jgi:cytochrome c oxidase assembly factor CtaG